jgi:hypothetical protein
MSDDKKLFQSKDAEQVSQIIAGFLNKAHSRLHGLRQQQAKLVEERNCLNALPPPKDVLVAALRDSFAALNARGLEKLAYLVQPLKANDADRGPRIPEAMLHASRFSPDAFLQACPFELLFSCLNPDAAAAHVMAALDWAESDDTGPERAARLADLQEKINALSAEIESVNAELSHLGLKA